MSGCCGLSSSGAVPTLPLPDPAPTASSKPPIRILLLGPGDTGKSTFLRQLKCLHGNGFEEAELDAYGDALRRLSLDTMADLLQALRLRQTALRTPEPVPDWFEEMAALVEDSTQLTEEVAQAITQLWSLEQVKRVSKRRSELCPRLPSCAA